MVQYAHHGEWNMVSGGDLFAGELAGSEVLGLFGGEAGRREAHAVLEDGRAAGLGSVEGVEVAPFREEPRAGGSGPGRRALGACDDAGDAGAVSPELLAVVRGGGLL